MFDVSQNNTNQNNLDTTSNSLPISDLILSTFKKEDQETINTRLKSLRSIVYFIGKDFAMGVELSQPGSGWHWNPESNTVHVDPMDLHEKPIDFSRFVIAHEGAHRRISRIKDLPQDLMQEPGFSLLLHTLEDARVNNFVSETYPVLKRKMEIAYMISLDIEGKNRAFLNEELGFVPKFIEAAFEYTKLWLKELSGDHLEVDHAVDEEIKKVLKATMHSASDAWNYYPSKVEAELGEELIGRYSATSHGIILERVWPEYKKLIEEDMKSGMFQSFLRGQSKKFKQNQKEAKQSLSSKLSDKEIKELEQALKSTSKGVPQEKLSKETIEKLKKMMDELPPEEKEKLKKEGEKLLKEAQKNLNDEKKAKLINESAQNQKELKEEKDDGKKTLEIASNPTVKQKDPFSSSDAKVYLNLLTELRVDIESFQSRLLTILQSDKEPDQYENVRRGQKINIRKRMVEIASDVPAHKTKAWQKKLHPSREPTYSVAILIDLSGSMRYFGRVNTALKGAVIIGESLNKLGIPNCIYGFNSDLYEFKEFDNDLIDGTRENLASMINYPYYGGASTDLGWAIKQTSDALEKQNSKNKLLIVISDGEPEPSPPHSGPKYYVSNVVKEIYKNTNQTIIPLGLGEGNHGLKNYFPNTVTFTGIKENELVDKMLTVIENFINENKDKR